jgi:hypothetical protein
LTLFEEIANSRWFESTSIILFLNKRDLFQKKIQEVSLKVCFPEYDQGNDYEAASNYMIQKFLSCNHSEEKQIYHHLTCATDTQNIRFIFKSVTDIIIQQSLNEAGLK